MAQLQCRNNEGRTTAPSVTSGNHSITIQYRLLSLKPSSSFLVLVGMQQCCHGTQKTE